MHMHTGSTEDNRVRAGDSFSGDWFMWYLVLQVGITVSLSHKHTHSHTLAHTHILIQTNN